MTEEALVQYDDSDKGEAITSDEQIAKWVDGTPIHQRHGECCPDFSCCKPELLAPRDIRIKFRDADEATRHGMLGHFLAAAVALAAHGKKVYIAGQGPEQ